MTSEEKAERLGYWKGQHQSWQASGLTQRAYCEREGLLLRTSLPSHTRPN